MTALHEIQRQIVDQIKAAPTGSWLRFKLMNAAEQISGAIEVEERERAKAEAVS